MLQRGASRDFPAALYIYMPEKGDENLIQLETLRHSTAHVMADAVKHLFPEVKITIGPAIEEGFYYDFDYKRPFSPEDLEKIEKEMHRIVKAKCPFVRQEVSRDEARQLFKDEPYKLELIRDLPEGEVITIYRSGDFVDLCRGPHVEHTGKIGAFKLLSVAGAYWRGDERNPMLQRIYGTAFATQSELDDYLKRLEEAGRRDHRKLGRELDLFSTMEEYGGGLILWHPKGGRIRDAIESFWKDQHYRNGYDILYTPHIGRSTLWETSGHLDFYRDSMYSPMDIDGNEYFIKPMNCPFHIMIYKTQIRSYRDLPLRWAELGTVYRYEKSGVLHGLMRVRGFTQDDAHIFCRPDQLEDELKGALSLALFMLKTFGFEHFKVMLSTRPEKYIGSEEIWERSTSTLKTALQSQKIDYTVDEGAGVFYGPKIDIKLVDAIGRDWQGPTIQVDFNLPERFQMEYIGQDGKPHRPVMVHRTVLGSMERFVGTLIEHYSGRFPLWLAPVQALILTVGEKHIPFANEVRDLFRQNLVRVEIDDSENKLGYKIREAQVRQIPCMLVVGDRELEDKTVNMRSRSGENVGALPARAALDRILNEIASKS